MTTVPAQAIPSPRRMARLAWPLSLVIVFLVGLGDISDGWPDWVTIALALVGMLAAIALCAYAVGGLRGLVLAALLLVLTAYSAWLFGWHIDYNDSPFSLDLVAYGLADFSLYLLGLLVILWPIVVLSIAAVAIVARRRGRPVWTAVGLLFLALVVLATPWMASWGDGCNGGSGAVPAIVTPAASTLMDYGVGVMPLRSSTLMFCSDVGDREWKPFWLGGDGLPVRR